jgi:peptide/nickel transport system substrate-binding protein
MPVTNGTIVTMEYGQAVSMDFQTDDAYDTASQEPTQACYETLFFFNGKDVTTAVPVLATGYNLSSDGLVYTIYLRPNVTFHDGTAFNASAVKYSLDRLFLVNNGQAYNNFVGTVKGYAAFNDHLANTTQADVDAYLAAGGIKVINETTVQITLESPNSNFVKMLTFSACSIMSPTFDQAHGGYDAINHKGNAYLVDHEAGTGPFVMTSFLPKQSITLERYNSYWKGPAASAKIIIQQVDDWNTRLLGIQSGDADFITVDSLHAPEVSNQSGLTLVNFPGLTAGAVEFNYAIWPWNDSRVRQAFVESFNKTLYIQTATNGYATALEAPIPAGLVGGDVKFAPQKFDPADAKKLLISAGFTPANKTTVTITYNKGNTNRQRMNQMIADQVNSYTNETGLTVNVQEVDWAQYIPLMNQGLLPYASVGWQADYPGTDNFIACFAYSKGYYMSLFNNPGNATADALYLQSLKETDPTKQAALYKQIVEITSSDYPYIYTFQSQNLFAYNNNVKGIVYNPLNGGIYVNYYTVYK